MLAVGTIPCAVCGEDFEPITRNGKYCKPACARVAKEDSCKGRRAEFVPHELKCQRCGVMFLRRHGRGIRFYCDSACAKAAEYEAWQKAYRARKAPDLRPCKWCEKDFSRKGSPRVYCSNRCIVMARRERQRAAKFPDAPCAHCGAPFKVNRADKTHCSRACVVKGIRARAAKKRRQRRIDAGRPVSEPKRQTVMATRPAVAEKYEPIKLTQHGYNYSGYSESNPREATGPGPTGCPHCRAAGMYQGKVIHQSWCREAEVS